MQSDESKSASRPFENTPAKLTTSPDEPPARPPAGLKLENRPFEGQVNRKGTRQEA